MMLDTPTLDRLRARLDAGDRRVLLWGPPGSGRSTTLAIIGRERGCRIIDATDREQAQRALDDHLDPEPAVVAFDDRRALSADSYVECALPSMSACVAWLERELDRQGITLDGDDRAAQLQAIVEAAEQLPAALVRACSLLRVLSARELIDRCAQAQRASRSSGALVAHPLGLGSTRERCDLSQDEVTIVAQLCAAGALSLEELEARAAAASPPIDAVQTLAALRDRALVRELRATDAPRRWSAPLSTLCALRSDPRFIEALSREHRACIARASARNAAWRARGDIAILDATERERASIEAAASVATAPDSLDDRVEAQLLLSLVIERREGVASAATHLSRAMERVADERSAAWAALAIERVRCHRLCSEWSAVSALLERVTRADASPHTRASIEIERAFALRLSDPDDARERMQRAHDAFASLGLEYERVQTVISLGSLAFWRQRFDEAVAYYERARDHASSLGAQRAEATALTNVCLCHTLLGDDVAATAAGSRAIALFRVLGDVGAEGTTLGNLGMIALQRARYDQAECRFHEAEALLERAGYFEQWRYTRFNQVALELARGRVREAVSELDRAESLLAMRADPYVTLYAAVLRADLLEAQGRFAEALASLDRGLRAGATLANETAVMVAPRRVRLLARLGQRAASAEAAREACDGATLARSAEQRMAFDLAMGHAAWVRGERAEIPAADSLRRALAPAWLGLAARERVGESVLESTQVRRAAALYWADLDAAARTEIEWSARDPQRRGVCLDEGAGVARLPGGALLQRSSRRNAFALLAILARVGPEPIEPIEKDALIEALWPGERIQRTAASNRLSNAVAQLRALSDGPIIAREGERYHLASGLAVVRVAPLPILQNSR